MNIDINKRIYYISECAIPDYPLAFKNLDLLYDVDYCDSGVLVNYNGNLILSLINFSYNWFIFKCVETSADI